MRVGFVLFPNLTQLDFTGPLQVLHRMPGAEVVLAAKTLAPIPSDCGLSLVPTRTFATCEPLDLICVPGGFGIEAAIGDDETMRFVSEQGARAKWVTSVCTGAFVLGAAGLLRGKRATTHWAYHHLLPTVGATPVKARTVRDGNVFTGGGVTAGIDFAFTLAAELCGEAAARTIQLSLEYDPSPPLDGGTPGRAWPETKQTLDARYVQRLAATEAAVTRRLR
ncbi:MAG: DJ-1/PfpI family protein [Archangium sp.]